MIDDDKLVAALDGLADRISAGYNLSEPGKITGLSLGELVCVFGELRDRRRAHDEKIGPPRVRITVMAGGSVYELHV